MMVRLSIRVTTVPTHNFSDWWKKTQKLNIKYYSKYSLCVVLNVQHTLKTIKHVRDSLKGLRNFKVEPFIFGCHFLLGTMIIQSLEEWWLKAGDRGLKPKQWWYIYFGPWLLFPFFYRIFLLYTTKA